MKKNYIIILSISLNIILLIIIFCMIILNTQQKNKSNSNPDDIELKPRVATNLKADTDKYLNSLNQLQERVKNCDPGDLEEIRSIVKDIETAQYKLNGDVSASIKPDYPEIAEQLDDGTNKLKEIQKESSNK